MENSQIIKLTDALKEKRGPIESKWNDIDRLILPLNQGSFCSSGASEGEKNWSTLEVWDSTAPIGADRFAAMIHSVLFSGQWFGAKFRKKLNKDPVARAWLDEVEAEMFDAIMASNFEVETASAILEWVGYGNCCLTQGLVSETEWQGLDFSATPVKEMLFEEDWRGRPYRSFRPLMWSASKIVSKFRDSNDPSKPSPKVPEKILKALESGQDENFSVIFTVFPREGKLPMKLDEKVRAPLERPFGWKYVLREGAVTLDEGGFYEMPVFVGRYTKPANSMWGYGPALLALPTVKLLNTIQETEVNAGAKAVDPPIITTERGLLSDIDSTPGGIITVRSLEDIDTFESKGRFDVSEMLLDRHTAMVKKHFREDDIALKDSQMTATEVNRRFIQSNRFLALPGKRFQYDISGPVVQTTFNMMYRMGQLPEIPEVVLAEKPRMQIQFFGPLATAMKDDEAAGIERALAAKAAMTKMDPGSPAKFVIKDDVALRELCDRLSTPASMLATDEEVKAQMDNQAKLQQAAQQAQVAKTAMEAERAGAGADQMRREMEG